MEMRLTTLGEISTIIAGQSPESKYYNKEEKGWPFFQGKSDFQNKYPIATTWCTKPKKLAEENDILISVRAPVGAVNLCENEACIGRGLSAVRVNKECHYEYLYYYLKSHEHVIRQYETGSTFKAITVNNLKDIEVNIPENIEDQIKIANLCSQLEELIIKREKSINLLNELLKSTFLDMFGDPILNTKKLDVELLKNVTTKITDGTHKSPPMSESGYKYITARHIKQNNVIDFDSNPTYIEKKYHDEIFSRCNPEKGDVLYIKDGATTGIACINNLDEPFSLLSSVALLKPSEEITSEFLMCFLNFSQHKLTGDMAGGAIKRLTLKKINLIEIIIPPKKLQKKFTSLFQQIEKTKAFYSKSLKELKELYGGLSQKAFKGELSFSKSTTQAIPKPSQKKQEHKAKTKIDKDYFLSLMSQSDKSMTFDHLYKLLIKLHKKKNVDYNECKEIIFELLEEKRIEQVFEVVKDVHKNKEEKIVLKVII